MQQNMNVITPQASSTASRSDRSVGENVQKELMSLRSELERIAHDLRMKSKGASAEIQDTRRMLEREAKRFGAEVEEAVDRTQRDLIESGRALRVRFQQLADEIALPSN